MDTEAAMFIGHCKNDASHLTAIGPGIDHPSWFCLTICHSFIPPVQ